MHEPGRKKGWAGKRATAPQKRAMRGTLQRFLKENMANVACYSLTAFGVCLFMDEEVDELGDGLEDLGIETYVEFLYYAELCETFWRIKKLGSRKFCSSLV